VILGDDGMPSGAKSGLGIRPELFGPIESIDYEVNPPFGFLEAHSENYFGESISRTKLFQLRENYPISLHGVGLSLGRADDLCHQHLSDLKQLVDQIDPFLVSEHLAWSAYSHRHLPDLLPLPLTTQALDVICQHVDQMQTVLGRQILIENPSNYLLFDQLQIPEPEFLNELAKRTGCGLLVDLNNIHVSSVNIGRSAADYIDAINGAVIGQYHLAGYTQVDRTVDGQSETILIDTHDQPVYDPVWALFEQALSIHGSKPTLFEWDSDFPEFDVLINECEKANTLLEKYPSKNAPMIRRAAPMIRRAAPIESISGGLDVYQSGFLDGILNFDSLLHSARADHKHRIWVYQNNVFGALLDYLAEVYPAVRGVVGADFFKQMAYSFIELSPPVAGNIHLYGEGLLETISSTKGLESLPYIADLIRYEWALHTSYFSVVSDALDPGSIAQDQLLTTSVVFNSSVSLVSSNYPVYEIQRQSLPEFEGKVEVNLNQSQDELLIYKSIHEVNCLVLDEYQAAFFKAINNSVNLLQAIEGVQGSIPQDVLSTTLSLVFENNLLVLSQEPVSGM
jgi:uncharacterized protein (UPF0276 family)